MKATVAVAVAVALCLGSSSAFAPATSSKKTTTLHAEFDARQIAGVDLNPKFDVKQIAGVVAPTGFFDPLGLADNADEATIKRYREAELTHGRVAMLATVGFLVGEKVEGSSFLFDSRISGPAITHLRQVPAPFWVLLIGAIGYAELKRATIGWVEPENIAVDKPGALRRTYIPGDMGFDPLGLMPGTEEELLTMQTKELQNGRLAMIAAAGFIAQECVDGKGIIEHFQA